MAIDYTFNPWNAIPSIILIVLAGGSLYFQYLQMQRQEALDRSNQERRRWLRWDQLTPDVWRISFATLITSPSPMPTLIMELMAAESLQHANEIQFQEAIVIVQQARGSRR